MKAQTLKGYLIAASVFAASAVTDMADGIIARRFNMTSRIGIMLDPFADKLTQGVIILCLSIKNVYILPLLVIFIIKEGFMLFMGCTLLKNGKMLRGALFSGKICTAVLFVSTIALVVFSKLPLPAVIGIVCTCTVFMLISLISYSRCFFMKSSHIRDIDEQ
jgi:cardiolipin synthase